MHKKKVYFIGIAGKTIGQLAKALKDQGWDVSGSDHKGIYPPVSTYLRKNKIPYFEGYGAENVPQDADLVVVGLSAMKVDRQNPEYLKAKTLGVPVLSYPEILQKYLIKEHSIVIAGTYGKTTTTATIAWILINADLDPSFMFGGFPLNIEDGVRITDSSYSVVEGDEPPSLFPGNPPKFMFYSPKYLLLTATHHDHPEYYPTERDYLKVFSDLIRLVPKKGLVVYNLDNVDQTIVSQIPCKKISYSLNNSQADYFIKSFSNRSQKTMFEISGKTNLCLETLLIGRHNLEDLCGAITMCLELGIKKEIVQKAIRTFRGTKTRLELIGNFEERIFYWDLAQNPKKVKGSLEALREHYSQRKIVCVFDPEMTGLKYKESLTWYPGNFDSADWVIVRKVDFLKEIKKEDRVTGVDIVRAISKTQKNVTYQPIDEKIFAYLTQETKPGDVVVFMSSGGLIFTNLIERVVDFFKK